MHRGDFSRSKGRQAAFTLIELLVVVAIIALLIAILVPSLAAAKRQAKTATCAANLKGLGNTMGTYAAEYEDSIIGGITTTGQSVVNFDGTRIAGVVDCACGPVLRADDWMTPMLVQQGVAVDITATAAGWTNRWNTILATKLFKCPENQITATIFSTGTNGAYTGPTTIDMPSYNTASIFYEYGALTYHNGARLNNVTTGATVNGNSGSVDPGNYSPKVSKIESAAAKVFIGEAANFSTTTAEPTVSILTNIGSIGGMAYSSPGACFMGGESTSLNKAWDRSGAPGNGLVNNGTNRDRRSYSFRHGSRSEFGSADSYKANFCFYDGHVETLGDLQAADPGNWMPTGSRWNIGNGASGYMRSSFGSNNSPVSDVAQKYLGIAAGNTGYTGTYVAR